MPDLKQLERVVWNQRIVSGQPDLKPVGKDWLMDSMPFHAVLRENLRGDRPLQYQAEGKFIAFKPVGASSSKGMLNANKRSVFYRNVLGNGISIEVQTSRDHWRKLIKIDSLASLGDLTGKTTVDFTFEVESDFNIPERENKKPRIRLGENSYIEVSQAWDSSPPYTDEELETAVEADIDLPDKNTLVRSFFTRVGSKLYFTKQIPVQWLKKALFPIWSDLDITWGTKQEFESGATKYCQCCEIDTNKFVVAYMDDADDDAGKAICGTVSGTTITWGAINEFCSNVGISEGAQLGICKLATDKFVVVYPDDAADDDGFARVGTVATRTISWGVAKEFETGDCEYPSCCQLGTDKFAIAYNDETAGDLGTVCVCTVATDTITAGTPVAFESKTEYNRCCKLDTDKFVAIYKDSADNQTKACAFTVSTTTPTAGTIKTIDTGAGRDCYCEQLDTDKCVIAWRSAAPTTKAQVCTTSGTTITEGAEAELHAGAGYNLGIAVKDTTHFLVVYRDSASPFGATSRYCSVSGTTITLGAEEAINSTNTYYLAVCLISTGKVAVAYQDTADANDIGEAIVGDIPTAWTKDLSDTLSISDSLEKDVGLFKSDGPFSLADSPSKGIGLFKSEVAMGIADAISKEPGLVKSESAMSITDALSKEPGLGKAETFGITDAGIVKDIGVVKAETMAIADALVKGMGLTKAETLAITDALVKGIGIIQAETMAIADSMFKTIGLGKADTVTIADALTKDVSKALVDAIAIVDAMVPTGSYARPGIPVAAFLFQRAIILRSRREF